MSIQIPYPEYSADISFCREIHKQYGKSFYFGTKLFSKEKRDATCVLYAFFRFPDEYVDTDYATEKEVAHQKLDRWQELWKKSYAGETFDAGINETRILRAATYVFKKYSIPFSYSEAFLKAMIQDTTKSRYATYTELKYYMFGSASVVGLMLTYVLSSDDPRFQSDESFRTIVLEKAEALGEAFQMTNFLRDIGEDMDDRGRIYIPQEDLRKFGVSEEDIRSHTCSTQFVEMMKYEIAKTEELYQKADTGIKLLPGNVSKGIYVARVLYSKILDTIVANGYNSLSQRASLSFIKKVYFSLSSLV